MITAFGTVWPCPKFKLDAFGRGLEQPSTVTNPPPTIGKPPSTTVTFNDTASTPTPGTPPAPATFTRNGPADPSTEPTLTPPGRVSTTRNGVTATNKRGGVTAAEGADAGPVPTAFVAVTVNV